MNNKFSLTSLIINILVILGIIYHNWQLAVSYNMADGKTKALFGLTELARLNTKIYLGLFIVFSLILGITAWIKKEAPKYYLSAIGLSFLSLGLLFISLWPFMV